MKRLRKAAALALSIILVLGLLPASVVHAAYTPVAVSVESYSSGTVNIKWPSVSGTSTVRVTYHTPNADDTVNTVVLNSTAAGATFSVPNLESDYIYDIDLRLFSTSGTEIGSGLLYYCPGITFYSKSVDTGYEDLTGGGRQSGHIPELNLRWMEPKIYNGAANFERMTAFDSMGMMETMINNRYGALNGNIDLASMNYRINLATDEAKLNGNPDEAALIIQYDSGSGDYLAHVSTNTTSPYTAEVTQDIYGYYSFDLRGRADTATTIDTTGLAANILPDDDILPGTVYYMNVKPMILNAAGTQQSVVTVGNPDDQNGTVLSGAVSYAYTPLRFQLTKDSINNIYVKVYRINQGSLDLPRLYYEIQAGDDPSKTGDWTVMYTLDDSYFVGETTTVPIDGGNPNNTVYYKIVVKSDNNTDRLESLKMPYMLSIDSSRPPVLTGISVTGRTLHSSGVMTLPHPADPANTTISFKSTDITVTWDKPEVWNTSKAALAVSFLVSTNQSDLAADSPVPLYINGTYWDEYPVKYRLVKYVAGASTNIIDNGTTLSYTIDALSLFQGEAADGSAIDFNTDAYPG
ncbi:MAG: ferrous iron transporter A, partial [Clostridiales bacterium]|nr:ferrous iron transporter A [Clostridiales bacterium]